MPQNNLKQADVLEGATLLPNPNGSAPGQWLDVTFDGYRKLIALLPGPPHECLPLFDAECLQRIQAVAPPRHIAVRTLKAAMIPESQADKLLAPVYTTYTDVETTLLAHAGDLQITLICAKPDAEAARNAWTNLPRDRRDPRRLALLFAGGLAGADRSLLSRPAPGHTCRGGKLHGRTCCPAHQLLPLAQHLGHLPTVPPTQLNMNTVIALHAPTMKAYSPS